MTKKEIAATIAETAGVTALQAHEIVQKTFDAIVQALLSERRIELRGFGVFEVQKRAARTARNPRTGEKVFVSEKLTVTFHPGKELAERIQAIGSSPASASDAA